MSNLVLEYWPEENGEGCSAWRLARKDNQPMKFPRTFDLMRLFRRLVPRSQEGLQVIGRGSTFRMVLMRVRLPKRYRDVFLKELEKRTE